MILAAAIRFPQVHGKLMIPVYRREKHIPAIVDSLVFQLFLQPRFVQSNGLEPFGERNAVHHHSHRRAILCRGQ